MASPETPVPDAPPGLLSVLARNRKPTGYALLVIAALFALIPLWMVYHYKLARVKPAETAGAEENKPAEEVLKEWLAKPRWEVK